MNTPIDGTITLADGLPGFETSRQFVLVVAPDLGPFTMVKGLDGDAPAFLAIDPRQIDRGYDLSVPARDLSRLGAAEGDALMWLALVAMSPDGTPTANLLAPVVINPATMRGVQLLRDESAYPVNYPIKAA